MAADHRLMQADVGLLRSLSIPGVVSINTGWLVQSDAVKA
jgi:hypothetical protein